MAMATGETTRTGPGARPLDPLITPASIAVVGASSSPSKAGHQLMRALEGFPGRLYPVNPGAREVLGHPAYPAVAAIPEPVDLAVLVVPASLTPAMLAECAAAGVRAAIVCAGGFAESGPAGADLQEQATRTARQAGMRLLGPNTSGLVNPVDGVRATFLSTVQAIPPGRLAIVASSGGVSLACAHAAAAEGIGVRLAVGLGNAVDVGHADLLDHLAADPSTAVIAIHIEGVRDGRGLVDAVERASASKPVVALALGESDVSDFARSHTGALATSWGLTRAALGQGGAVVVDDVTELLDAARALLHVRLAAAPSPGVGVVTAQAGPGLLVTDRLRARGVRVPELAAATRERIAELLPPLTYQRNPVDTARPDERFGEVVAAVQGDPGIDAVVVYALHEPGALDPADVLRPARTNPSVPLLLVSSGPPGEIQRLRATVEGGGVPLLTAPERGAAAMRALVADARAAYRRRSRRPSASTHGAPVQLAPPRGGAPLEAGPLDEDQAKRLLEQAGLRVPRRRACDSREQARQAAAKLGGRVVVKVLDASINHKTEVGGVHVGVEPGAALERALEAIDRLAPPGSARYLVEELLPPGLDLIVGAVRDPSFGPVVLVGLGGVLAEALADSSTRLAPLAAADGHEMLDELHGRKLLDGFRGGQRVDRDELVTALQAVGTLLLEHPEIAELDVNPLRATHEGLIAADALVIVDRAGRP
ncbi:MAG TPA: acetate--CoA ligase family protein [Actinomycetes bacterium]|jgi:acetyltransferase|nr:acetate--CoA ligase family protein [Actinomycetes bacterium]